MNRQPNFIPKTTGKRRTKKPQISRRKEIFKQKTAYEMCVGDWSSDVCSSDLWEAAKAVLGGKFIAIQSYLKKQEKHQIDNLTLHLKELEKEEQKFPKISRRKEIIKI